MRNFDLSPLYRSEIGFDRLFNHLENNQSQSNGYPPYNVELVDENHYRIAIAAFRQAGYEVAIGDFGTGYSNLHNLYSLNVDILKIDKCFIDTLTTNSTSHLIAEHIIEMAQSLRLKTGG
ncbi:unnamed protein product [Euphydryas editha]|uniref:EAL domain-containing protein n=1 Tax=Euphydryas editha TaxID=104508 RepID=A0AAU9V637_EUPED|nr:unnamed protein product [Euphydryas editha]